MKEAERMEKYGSGNVRAENWNGVGGGAIKRRDSTAGGRLSRGAPLDCSDLMAEVFPAQNLFKQQTS